MKEGFWCNDIPMTEEEKEHVRLVREAGCKCDLPLLGYIPGQGPRCRMCGAEAKGENEDMNWQGQKVYAIREIDRDNFSRMVRDLIDRGLLRGYIQILVDVVGGREWINVKRSELKLGGSL
jgi:hypothetical protein